MDLDPRPSQAHCSWLVGGTWRPGRRVPLPSPCTDNSFSDTPTIWQLELASYFFFPGFYSFLNFFFISIFADRPPVFFFDYNAIEFDFDCEHCA